MLGALGLLGLALAAILQATLLTRLPSWLRPDLVLVLVLAWAMQRSVVEGSVAGLLGGLALDLVSLVPFGTHALLLSTIGGLTALAESSVFRDNWPLFWATTILATLALHGGSALALQATGQQLPSFPAVVQLLAPKAVLNAALIPLVYWATRRLLPWFGGWRPVRL